MTNRCNRRKLVQEKDRRWEGGGYQRLLGRLVIDGKDQCYTAEVKVMLVVMVMMVVVSIEMAINEGSSFSGSVN